VTHFGESFGALGIVGDTVDSRSRQHQVIVARARLQRAECARPVVDERPAR
jgi:hypothetical protein